MGESATNASPKQQVGDKGDESLEACVLPQGEADLQDQKAEAGGATGEDHQ